MEFVLLDDALRPAAFDDRDDQVVYQLTPHRKCACHALNLVATTVVSKLESGSFKKVSVQTLAKLTALWNKQNRSTLAAEKIRDALGTLLPTPGDTRWNSTYDAIAKVRDILSNMQQSAKFDKLLDDMEIVRLQAVHKTFVSEYVEVMRPLCCGLDVLQGDSVVGLGYLLPTLTVIRTQLSDLLNREENPITICRPLALAVQNGLFKRFEDMFNDTTAQLAAGINPMFKLDWVDDVVQKARLTELLKNRVTASLKKRQPSALPKATCSQTVSSTSFFAGIAVKRQKLAGEESDVAAEVDRYLADASNELQSLNMYSHVKKQYITLNTTLPASAAVERLFSLGGRIFLPTRSRLSSEHFEMMMFLRMAKW